MEHKLPNGRTLNIFQDNDFNPRKDQDNLGSIYSWHSRYSLADKKSYDSDEYFQLSKDDYCSAEDAVNSNTSKENVVILPLYMYDHSGITISTTPFHCPWDSGQFGFITVTKETLRKEFNCKKVTKKIIEKAKSILEQEVKEYDHYLTGNQYSFMIDGEEEGDNVVFGPFWGYDLFENGMLDELSKEDKDFLLKNNKETIQS